MDEIFPILGGIVLGLVFAGRLKTPLAYVCFAALALCIAVVASAISGELAASWWYIGVDLIEVVVATVLTALVVPILRRAWSVRHP
jgi:hypothetical protein